jgi:DNA-binding GntR family transcriptional regulator
MTISEQERPKALRGPEIYGILKQRIIRWEYAPGHRFTEDEICREFQVSRSPVREVLRMLEEHGLVDKVPYRGCTVKQPDFAEIHELYDVRLLLELGVVEQLAQRGIPSDLAERLVQHWNALAAVVSIANLDMAYEDRTFHEALAKATGNGTLCSLLQTINERLHFARMTDITSVERLRDTCRQHHRILAAIAAHDVVASRDTMRENVEGARQHVETAIKEALARAYLAR